MPIMPSDALAHASFHRNFARATTTTSSVSATSTTSSSTTNGIISSSNIVLSHDAIIWISCFATLATIGFVVVVLLLCTGVFDKKKKGTHEYGGVLDDRNMYQTWNPDAPLSDEAFEGGTADLRDRKNEDESIAMTSLTGAASPIAGSPLNTPPRAHSPMLVPQQDFMNVADEGRRRNVVVKRPRPQTRYYTGGWRASVLGRAVGNRISLMGQNNREQ
ncbi:Protein phosphatase PP2A regulatory subunit B [Teratosphaeria destructans]|uniref:Protein phosphatase PP2A regulatory subunit B n=1 Tax=Teratosphaeria destructans TaxID=418781 RepID=A0A9W7SKD8_9PEZI|nr:Protein phosphatase PP2A regulatory subunit B [Teratosphaeria destructans]